MHEAFLLSLPLTILGIYCVFPHPFYDPDATFVILLAVFLLCGLSEKVFRQFGRFCSVHC